MLSTIHSNPVQTKEEKGDGDPQDKYNFFISNEGKKQKVDNKWSRLAKYDTYSSQNKKAMANSRSCN